MNRMRFGLVLLLVVALAAAWSPVEAKKKVKERSTQVSQTFVNETGQTAYGLVVKLSAQSAVVTDDDNKAGPFRNINGNDTSSITLTNPDTPVADGESTAVSFRSYSGSARIKKFWWIDLSGKRIGDKQKI